MSSQRLPVGALLLVALLVGEVRGLVDVAAWARTAVGLPVATAAEALRGYDAMLAKHFPGSPPKRRRKPKAAAKPRSSPPAAAAPSGAGIPPRYLHLYREAGAGEVWGGLPAWAVLAGIGAVESGHGQSSAPGVRSGVNRFGCCAGPMQFNLRNGPPSTWDTYGRGSPYDPADAIPAAARLLRANGARRDLDGALFSYNHSAAYVAGVKAQARRYRQEM